MEDKYTLEICDLENTYQIKLQPKLTYSLYVNNMIYSIIDDEGNELIDKLLSPVGNPYELTGNFDKKVLELFPDYINYLTKSINTARIKGISVKCKKITNLTIHYYDILKNDKPLFV